MKTALLVGLSALALIAAAGVATAAAGPAADTLVYDAELGLYTAGADCMGIPVIPCCIPSTNICLF